MNQPKWSKTECWYHYYTHTWMADKSSVWEVKIIRFLLPIPSFTILTTTKSLICKVHTPYLCYKEVIRETLTTLDVFKKLIYSFYKNIQSEFYILGFVLGTKKHTQDPCLLGVYILERKTQNKKATYKWYKLQIVIHTRNKQGVWMDSDRKTYFGYCKPGRSLWRDDIESETLEERRNHWWKRFWQEEWGSP